MSRHGALRARDLLVSSPGDRYIFQALLRQLTDFKRALSALSEIPESLLRAELLRRDGTQPRDAADTPSCGSRERGAYNTPLHIMALFLILGLSTFGTRRFPHIPDSRTPC